MNITFKFSILLIFVALIACGGGRNNSITSNDSSINSVDTFAAQSVGEVKCDGEGTELSGVYNFNFSESTLSCPNVSDRILPPTAAQYKCTQNNTAFSCGKPDSDTAMFNGCVGKDGKFKLSYIVQGNPNSAMTTYSPVVNGNVSGNGMTVQPGASGFRNGETKIFMVGTLNKEDGKVQYSVIQQNARQQGACVSISKLAVQATN